MSSPPPTKPPRGVKQGKETSGLLMSVIRTLSASETNEQREKERVKLEKEYKRSDAKLDELLREAHASEIMEVMQKFNVVSSALNSWGGRLDGTSARLAAAQRLLQLRRDDLKRLWFDSRTHHYALEMLTHMSVVLEAEKRVNAARAAGRVLGAAAELRDACGAAADKLATVHALRDTRRALQNQKQELVDEIVKRLNKAVYKKDYVTFTRQPSTRKKAKLLLAELTKTDYISDSLQQITPELESCTPVEGRDFETEVVICLEALALLEQLKEATEKFKVQIQTELLEVVETVTRRIIEDNDVEECERDGESGAPTCERDDECAEGDGRQFAKLMNTLVGHFIECGDRNKRLIQVWRAILRRMNVTDKMLQSDHDYWSAVQQVLQLLLSEYLAGAPRTMTTLTTPTSSVSVADYFGRRPVVRGRLYTLQKTETVSPAATAGADAKRVCPPAASLLYCALSAVYVLCDHVEAREGANGECSLRAFLTKYMRDNEAERLSVIARNTIEQALRSNEAWRERNTDTALNKSGRAPLRSVSLAWDAVHMCVVRTMRARGAPAARAVLAALGALAVAARARHASVVAVGGGAGRLLADDDIVRFLQSLANWKLVVSNEPMDDKQWEQELRAAHEREAESLGASLASAAMTERDLVRDEDVLSDLAIMAETMAWISSNIRNLPSVMSGAKLPEKLMTDITSAALIFDEIQHKCLLFLHLEIRIQCYYWLACAPCGADLGAATLARTLQTIHARAAGPLSPRRLRYVLEGADEVMAAGVVARGAGRPSTLRHTLATLRVRGGAGLARAERYLGVLRAAPKEIIQSIKDKGPEFSELEYLNAFKIIAEKRNISQVELKGYLKQMSSALGHIGVTV